MNWLRSRDNRLKLKTSGNFTDLFTGIYRIYLKWIKPNRNMSTCNRLDLELLGSWPTMPKNLPGTGLAHLPWLWISFHNTKSEPHFPLISWVLIAAWINFEHAKCYNSRQHVTNFLHETWGKIVWFYLHSSLSESKAMIGENRELVTDIPVDVQDFRRITAL